MVGPGLRVLFCGINPGLMSAYQGRHFARPGNRFWPALHASGFTPRRFAPAEQDQVLALGFGLTNVAPRATARADELTAEELVAGGRSLTAKVARHRPEWLAVLGVTAYRVAFADKHASVGPQERTLGGARVWVLPSPSGLNAHWSPTALAEEFARLRAAAFPADRAELDGSGLAEPAAGGVARHLAGPAAEAVPGP
ncbi:G/U mismatch-specific uracil-DNA glycosylase [Actinacidiphila yanglinensis]|uniref:G/U mismatch-specific uracil-DNA glycosylase n=1 Tax=Actinacidiphila yanglinensis TaxID=310779 RepID=A0A1H6CCW7_9ACTN|nr:G/U mismatch-specific uracil-DNA glycosylase [Actinacidiphila yanglinensis]